MKRIIFFILSLSVSLNVFAQSDVINIISSGNVGISSTAPVSAFEVSGSYGQKVTTITGNTTLDETHNTIVCNNGGTAIAVTLPNATTCAGRVYVIKRNNSSSANVTITPTPTLDGQTSFVISMPNQSIEVFSDGTEWKSRVGGLSNNATAWGLSGNSGTVASTSSIGSAANNNFIGTTDANHFVIATNNLERLRFASGGNIGIGTLNPGFLLDINNTADINAFQFRTSNNLTGEKDVFTIRDEDNGGGGQDESSSFKVWKSGAWSVDDDAASLVELTYTGGTGSLTADRQFYVLGRLADEGAA